MSPSAAAAAGATSAPAAPPAPGSPAAPKPPEIDLLGDDFFSEPPPQQPGSPGVGAGAGQGVAAAAIDPLDDLLGGLGVAADEQLPPAPAAAPAPPAAAAAPAAIAVVPAAAAAMAAAQQEGAGPASPAAAPVRHEQLGAAPAYGAGAGAGYGFAAPAPAAGVAPYQVLGDVQQWLAALELKDKVGCWRGGGVFCCHVRAAPVTQYAFKMAGRCSSGHLKFSWAWDMSL
jgi:hypothetical protein